jgi:hypothetical protein
MVASLKEAKNKMALFFTEKGFSQKGRLVPTKIKYKGFGKWGLKDKKTGKFIGIIGIKTAFDTKRAAQSFLKRFPAYKSR